MSRVSEMRRVCVSRVGLVIIFCRCGRAWVRREHLSSPYSSAAFPAFSLFVAAVVPY